MRACPRRRWPRRWALSATPVWRRVKELEERGVIRGQVALVDREKLGLSICVLANVSLVRHSEGAVEQFERLVARSARSSNAMPSPARRTTSSRSSPPT